MQCKCESESESGEVDDESDSVDGGGGGQGERRRAEWWTVVEGGRIMAQAARRRTGEVYRNDQPCPDVV
jgi:hypothetical protein